jgi:hypothetical protein
MGAKDRRSLFHETRDDLPERLHTQTLVQTRAIAQKSSQGCFKEQAKCQMMVPVINKQKNCVTCYKYMD